MKNVYSSQYQTTCFGCCILGGPGGERIMDVVPRRTELELQLRRGVGQASHTCNNLHIKCTGVY
jgi:hypothetical protein